MSNRFQSTVMELGSGSSDVHANARSGSFLVSPQEPFALALGYTTARPLRPKLRCFCEGLISELYSAAEMTSFEGLSSFCTSG